MNVSVKTNYSNGNIYCLIFFAKLQVTPLPLLHFFPSVFRLVVLPVPPPVTEKQAVAVRGDGNWPE